MLQVIDFIQRLDITDVLFGVVIGSIGYLFICEIIAGFKGELNVKRGKKK